MDIVANVVADVLVDAVALTWKSTTESPKSSSSVRTEKPQISSLAVSIIELPTAHLHLRS